VSVYLSGWTVAGIAAGVLGGVAADRVLLMSVGGVVGMVVGAFASRRAVGAFHEGRGPALRFPGVRRWAVRGGILGYAAGVVAIILWERLAPVGPTPRLGFDVPRPPLSGLLPLAAGAGGYLVGLAAGLVAAAVRGPPPDVTRVFE
jgi:hypothetical protein